VVNFQPEWVAGLNRNARQLYPGMDGRFEPESTVSVSLIELVVLSQHGKVNSKIKHEIRNNSKTILIDFMVHFSFF